ncbi:hypothetical protein AB4245_04825, partial [Vibrio splendidus]
LHEQALQLLKGMLAKLKDFKAKSTTGKFPGKNEIEDGIISISSLVEQQGSYKFIDEFLRQGSGLEEFEEDYEELEVFYEKQFSTWQSLANALSIEFAKNRHLLKTSEVANTALEKLEAIYNNERPYGKIFQVQGLIETVRTINDEMLVARRKEVASKLEAAIDDVQQHVSEAKATDTISNDALRPLQLSRKHLEHLTSIAEINEELRNSESLVEQAEEIINAFIDQQIKAAERQAALEEEHRKKEAQSSQPDSTKGSSAQGNGALDLEPIGSVPYGASATKEPLKVAEPVVAKPKAKKVVTVKAGAVFQELGDTTYLETEEELDNYLAALKTQLSGLIASNHKVRIK